MNPFNWYKIYKLTLILVNLREEHGCSWTDKDLFWETWAKIEGLIK